VPAGATPKDGPSAGVAMLSSLLSLLRKRAIDPHIAMTGELTLTGRVLPIGGVKEKVLAASRAGITDVILPAENKRDLQDVPMNVRKGLRFHFARTAADVCHVVFPDHCPPASKPGRAKSRACGLRT
jgi:ATP-dependent Lon protease